MAQQLYEEGNLIDDGDNVFVVTAVSYHEDDAGEKYRFTYHVRLQSEVAAEHADDVSKRQADKLESNTKPTDEGEDLTDDDGVPRV